MALAAKGAKNKGGLSSGSKSEKDMSKVKCFAFQGYGHYDGKCHHKKKEEFEASTLVEVEEFARKFEGFLASIIYFR